VLDFENDPLCGATPSIGLIYDVLGGMEFVSLRKNMSKMRRSIPVIFISGDCDPFGEHGRGVIRAYKGFLRSGLTDVTLKLYHEGRHEILNEINREEVYLDLVGWLNKNAGVI
jgi:alpha-beta hydrolase superfamily lysophospholipase